MPAGVVTSGGNAMWRTEVPCEKAIGPADIESAGPISLHHLTNRGADHVDDYWQVGAAVGFVSQYIRVPKLSGPWRATAAARLSLFAEISVVE